MPNGSPYVENVDQTALAIAYSPIRDVTLLADILAPYANVEAESYTYGKFNEDEAFTLPDSKVGRDSEPNEITLSSEEVSRKCEPNGLSARVSSRDISRAKRHDPLFRATERLTDYILMNREVTVADHYQNVENYKFIEDMGTDHKFLDDPELDVLKWLKAMLLIPLMRPNYINMSAGIEAIITSHPSTLAAYHGNSGAKGLVPLDYIVKQLKIKGINIGESRINVAKKGKAANYQYAWHNHFSATYNDETADFDGDSVTFALTARTDEGRISGNREIQMGLDKGTQVMVGEYTDVVSIAPGCGVLFTNVLGYVAPAE
jgi:hypothetical protein